MSFQIQCIRTCAQDFVRSFLVLCLFLPFFVYPDQMHMSISLPTGGSIAVFMCQLCMMAAVMSLCNCVLDSTLHPFIRYIKGFHARFVFTTSLRCNELLCYEFPFSCFWWTCRYDSYIYNVGIIPCSYAFMYLDDISSTS